jgi:hypothetical protein
VSLKQSIRVSAGLRGRRPLSKPYRKEELARILREVLDEA